MRKLITATALTAFLLSGTVSALEFRFDGDHLWLKAKRVPLSEILNHFVHAGVSVEIDPNVDVNVTGTLKNVPVEEALDEMLEQFSYAVVWDVLDGPLGPLPKLERIRIYEPGRGQRALQPMPRGDGNLVVTRGPIASGPMFVRDELLLSVRVGTSIAEFRKFLQEIGGVVIDSIPHLGVYRIRVPRGTNIPALVEQLQQKKLIGTVEPNYVFRGPTPGVSTGGGGKGGRATPETPVQGTPPVAVLDSGLAAVAGVGEFVVGQLDALDPSRQLSDRTGHGTQMALIASGLVRPDGAPGDDANQGVPILAIRAFDDNGYASNFSVMNSIAYAADQGAKALSMSWGTDTDSDFLRRAMADAQSKGMVVVASAGNVPHGKPVYPAAYSGVLAISAMNEDGTLWEKSNYGDMIFAAAPGRADFPVGHDGPPGAYAGTSIGAPFVAREISLYMARHPSATSRQAISAFQSSLSDAGPKGKDPQYGYGAFDAAAIRRFRGM